MVGLNDSGSGTESTLSENAMAGGLSGAITRLVLQPLDVIKIRFQLQVEPVSHRSKISKYRGIIQAMSTIWREETICGLWKGHVSAQALSIVYGVTQFTAFQQIARHIPYEDPRTGPGMLRNFYCGSMATGLATFVSFPFDVIRTRFIAQGTVKEYNSVVHGLCTMIRKEGIRSLYKGLTPTVLQSVPYGGCQFGFFILFFKVCNNVSVPHTTAGQQAAVMNLTAGFFAGLFAKAVVYPFDVIRKRLQIQGFNDVRTNFGKPFFCSGLIDCVVRIHKEESIGGFFKGLQPALIKASVTTSMYFTLYEVLAQYFETKT